VKGKEEGGRLDWEKGDEIRQAGERKEANTTFPCQGWNRIILHCQRMISDNTHLWGLK